MKINENQQQLLKNNEKQKKMKNNEKSTKTLKTLEKIFDQ